MAGCPHAQKPAGPSPRRGPPPALAQSSHHPEMQGLSPEEEEEGGQPQFPLAGKRSRIAACGGTCQETKPLPASSESCARSS